MYKAYLKQQKLTNVELLGSYETLWSKVLIQEYQQSNNKNKVQYVSLKKDPVWI